MKQLKTTAIILSRTNYGEADRILTLLTPDHGKLRLIARGVRKIKSKLAGGIELFSTSQIAFVVGKGEGLGTLTSTRLIKHYGHIAEDMERVQLGYELIRLLNHATADHPEREYYNLMEQAFAALDDNKISTDLIRIWFQAQLLQLGGHAPGLNHLPASQKYTFDLDNMTFAPTPHGRFTTNDIKFLRLLFGGHRPAALARINGSDQLTATSWPLIQNMLQTHLS